MARIIRVEVNLTGKHFGHADCQVGPLAAASMD